MMPRAALARLHGVARGLVSAGLLAGLPLAAAAHEDMTKGFIDNMLGACTDPYAPFAERLSLLHDWRAPDKVESRILLDLLAEAYARGSALIGRVESDKLEEQKDGLKARMTELLAGAPETGAAVTLRLPAQSDGIGFWMWQPSDVRRVECAVVFATPVEALVEQFSNYFKLVPIYSDGRVRYWEIRALQRSEVEVQRYVRSLTLFIADDRTEAMVLTMSRETRKRE